MAKMLAFLLALPLTAFAAGPPNLENIITTTRTTTTPAPVAPPLPTVAPPPPVVSMPPPVVTPAPTAEPNPCSTAAPAKTTCQNFFVGIYGCPANFALKAGKIFCGNGIANIWGMESECSTKVCCDVVTTVTTTPAPTVTTTPGPVCASFTCPKGWTKNGKADKISCVNGKCDMATCCNQNPCSTHTTTPGTTKVATTVTTTPAPPTCASFKCEAGSDPVNPAAVCAHGTCNAKQCCQTNPCAPQNVKPPAASMPPPLVVTPAPTPAPTPAASPCATAPPAAARLYNAKESVKQVTAPQAASAVPAWAFPLFGVVGMFSFVAFFSVRARRSRSTRQIHAVEPIPQSEGLDGDFLLTDDDLVLE